MLRYPPSQSTNVFFTQVARHHADEYCTQQLGYGASNMRFVEGHIEFLDTAGIADDSVRMAVAQFAADVPTQPTPKRPECMSHHVHAVHASC